MHQIVMKPVLLPPIIFILLVTSVLAQRKVVLNQEQAVAFAEKFAAENGYTAQKPIKRKKLFLEDGEKFSDITNIIARRSNSIEPRAVFALTKEVNGQSVWSVWFLFIEQDYEKQRREIDKIWTVFDFGREVRMTPDGRKIWMQRETVEVPAHFYGDCTGEDEKSEPLRKP